MLATIPLYDSANVNCIEPNYKEPFQSAIRFFELSSIAFVSNKIDTSTFSSIAQYNEEVFRNLSAHIFSSLINSNINDHAGFLITLNNLIRRSILHDMAWLNEPAIISRPQYQYILRAVKLFTVEDDSLEDSLSMLINTRNALNKLILELFTAGSISHKADNESKRQKDLMHSCGRHFTQQLYDFGQINMLCLIYGVTFSSQIKDPYSE